MRTELTDRQFVGMNYWTKK